MIVKKQRYQSVPVSLRNEILKTLQENGEMGINQLSHKLSRRKNLVIDQVNVLEEEGMVLTRQDGRMRLVKSVPFDLVQFTKNTHMIIKNRTRMAFSLIDGMPNYKSLFIMKNIKENKFPILKPKADQDLEGIADCIKNIVIRMGLLEWATIGEKLLEKNKEIIKIHQLVCYDAIDRIINKLLKNYPPRVGQLLLKHFLSAYISGY